MLSTIFYYIVVGAIFGALGRVLLPGRQNISVLMTIVCGIVGAVIGGMIVSAFAYNNNNGGIPWIGIIVSAICAAGAIMAYGAMTGRREIR